MLISKCIGINYKFIFNINDFLILKININLKNSYNPNKNIILTNNN